MLQGVSIVVVRGEYQVCGAMKHLACGAREQ